MRITALRALTLFSTSMASGLIALPTLTSRTLVKVGKAIKPEAIEVENNVRARSAVMRIAKRVA